RLPGRPARPAQRAPARRRPGPARRRRNSMTTSPRPEVPGAPAAPSGATDRTPRVVTTRADLRTTLDAWRADHPRARRVVVMTMGALHAGHLELVRRARAEAGPGGQVVVTDFVNPLQFGPGEDYERYPRDVAADVALLAAAGPDAAVDVVFAPAADEMYPDLAVPAGGAGPVVRVTSGRF